jgi:oxygen-independent coproporphyrinogen-3 oxidase
MRTPAPVLRVDAGLQFDTLPPLSLYVHLPWCVRKCPYCDFNSYEARGALPDLEYVDALLRDLRSEIELAQGRAIETSTSAAARRASSRRGDRACSKG